MSEMESLIEIQSIHRLSRFAGVAMRIGKSAGCPTLIMSGFAFDYLLTEETGLPPSGASSTVAHQVYRQFLQ
jgi:hypothetical protein